MEIYHLGHSCFKIKTKLGVLVTDPFTPDFTGLKFPAVEADIVTISHEHQDHNAANLVKGTPIIFRGPGEYEAKGIKIFGWKTYHDNKKGDERGENTIFQVFAEGFILLHLGDLGHRLTSENIEKLTTPHILFVPIGGKYTIDGNIASEIIAQLEPRIVIPMHYRTKANQDKMSALEELSIFLKRMGKENLVSQPKLHITKDSLPAETQIVVLEP